MPPRHRHQASLEGVFDLLPPDDLTLAERQDGERRLLQIVAHFEAQPGSTKPYSKPLLVRHTYEFAQSQTSKDNFMRVFFESMEIPLGGHTAIDFAGLATDFNDFADYLMNNSFLPLKAAGNQTVQSTPKIGSALQKLRSGHLKQGTPDRLSTLRALCLERDRHRCVVTRAFDSDELDLRDEPVDDNGVPLDPSQPAVKLEAAHIFAHVLTKASENSPELPNDKKTTLNILNMFDHGLTHLIDGVDIDRPRNAISLTQQMHSYFGNFKIFLEPAPYGSNAPPGDPQYRIGHFLKPIVGQMYGLPVTRTLFRSDTIDPPSPRLLATHRAIAHILHLSGAGDYIDKVLRDLDKGHIRADGSTRLDDMVKMRLGGWWDGTVRG